MIDRRLLRNLDFPLPVLVILLMGLGLLLIYSATHSTIADTDPAQYLEHQAVWVGVGLLVIVALLLVDYVQLSRWSTLIYAANLVMLGLVLLVGRTALGAQRWLQMGPISLQPSEFAKVGLIITLAATLARKEGKWRGPLDYLPPLLHVAVPTVLVVMQPDLGTSLVFLAILMGMLLVAGAPPLQLLGLTAGGVAAVALALYLHFQVGLPIPLKEYQLQRLIVFLHPDVDALGAGYHLRQSLIAVGSGRWLGKGLFAGAQSQLEFLPQRHTDFVFSVAAEELGFLGAFMVLVLYFLVVWRAVRIGMESKDLFGSLIATGAASMLAFHILVNVGMTIGIMPITGIPLPFLSYGGSALLTNCLLVGLLLSVSMRRRRILF
ncbi:MAG: rod shape-determining protein RodA [Acetobacteraceae bacterium]|nr:rod shape-determining protein RodA [Acetobacteraceae bacterium]